MKSPKDVPYFSEQIKGVACAWSIPGIDPYLEDPTLWPDVHLSLISYIREELQSQVRPKYIARIGERIEVSDLGRSYYRAAMIVQPPRNPATTLAHSSVLVADEPLVFHYLDEEHSVPYIEIVLIAKLAMSSP